MLTAQQVIDTYYLEARCMALEIAALFDRHDAAAARDGQPAPAPQKLEVLREAMAVLAENGQNDRTETLLSIFGKI